MEGGCCCCRCDRSKDRWRRAWHLSVALPRSEKGPPGDTETYSLSPPVNPRHTQRLSQREHRSGPTMWERVREQDTTLPPERPSSWDGTGPCSLAILGEEERYAIRTPPQAASHPTVFQSSLLPSLAWAAARPLGFLPCIPVPAASSNSSVASLQGLLGAWLWAAETQGAHLAEAAPHVVLHGDQLRA